MALADIEGVAREGPLALSVATGMSVMQAMFQAEVTAVAGVKGRHDPIRTAVRHGTEKGSVTLGGRRVPVSRPRARTVDGYEVRAAALYFDIVSTGFRRAADAEGASVR